MDKAEHGKRLKRAIAIKGYGRNDVAAAANVKPRTVTNWTSGATMPSAREMDALRKVLGDYDAPGDAVETAVRASELVEWRQDTVLATYKRNLYEQRNEVRGA